MKHREIPECWKPVVGYEDRYEVSNLGRLRSVPRKWTSMRRRHGLANGEVSGQILKLKTDKYGYQVYGLHQDNRNRKWIAVHTLVMSAFVGPRPLGEVIDHLDGNRSNNALNNLHYVSEAENVRLSDIRNGGRPWLQGENNPQGKLSTDQVREIRKLAAEGMVQRRIAEQFGIGPMQVSRIVKRTRWQWVQ